MKTKIHLHRAILPAFFSLLLLPVHFMAPMISTSSAEGATAKNGYLLDQALEAVGMKRDDLSIRSDTYDNPFVLSRFKRWMENPLKAPVEAQQKAMELLRLARNPADWFQELAKLGDIYPGVLPPLKRSEGYRLPAHAPEELGQAIHLILDAIQTAEIKLSSIRHEIPPDRAKLFEKYLYPDFRAGKNSKKIVKEPTRLAELREALAAAGSVDREAIFEAGLSVITAVVKARSLLTGLGRRHKTLRSFSFMTGLGLVEVGGEGSDTHENKSVLIIDLGGNDLYRGEMASGTDGECAVVLDLAGNDIYLGKDATQAAGFWGIGLLFDLEGDDLYQAASYSQGAGIFGVGLLFDGGGLDTYSGETFVQAASLWGWGGLIDAGGADTYRCHYAGQAYAEVLGVSCLSDLGGNDKYISGLKAPDPREWDMNQSFSQGFAYGLRNLTGGGFALLADESGNDLYQCEYFGQGASYWMGVGLLYDENGKDAYIARRYAQGAGIHFSLGLLMDVGGNDHTFSWGVSQGCGHDYGIGILINESGDDTYVSEWLSMGASEANGVGIFVDNRGNDGYDTTTGMGVGRLIESRRAGGIGLFMDAGGQDRYSNNGSNNLVWGVNRWGVGIDEEEGGISDLNIYLPEATSPVNEEAEERKIEESIRLSGILNRSDSMPYPDNVEEMLFVASHWGFEREIPKKAQEKLLGLNPAESVPAMIELIDTPDVMSFIFMEKFFQIRAFHATPELIKKTADRNPVIASRSLYYLGQLKDTRAVKYCVEALDNGVWRVESSSIRAIGEMLNKERLEVLVPMKEAFDAALEKNDPDLIKAYIGEDQKTLLALSVLTRAIPLDYRIYRKYAEMPSGCEKEDILVDYARFITLHLSEMIPLLERWIGDIKRSEDVSQGLMGYLDDPHPAIRKATAYTLGQMHYGPAIQKLFPLLNDPYLWVRDSAVLSLALLGDEAVSPLGMAMKRGTIRFRILALDVLARIGSDQAKAVIEEFIEDPSEGVKRAARQALGNTAK